MKLKEKLYQFLKWMERYTETDTLYLAKGGFWWVFGRIVIFLISLTIMMAFANFVPKETFGAYRYIISLIGILAIFSLPGMNTALIRAIAKGAEGMLLVCAKINFKWSLIGSLICLVVSLWYFFHQNFTLGISFLIVAFFFPFYETFPIFASFWHGKMKFAILSKYLIFSNFLVALILIQVIFLTDNLILIILAYFLSWSVFNGFLFKLTLKKVENQIEDKETISFGKHLTLMQIASIFGSQLDKIIIWQFLGPTALAIYSFAQLPILRIQELIPISPLALPKLSERNIKEIENSLFKKFLKLFLFSIPLTLFFILIAPFIYKILFPTYLESIPYFQVLALSLIFIPFSLLGTSLITEMRKKELYFLSYIVPTFQIILFFILIPFYQIWGAIFAILISQIFGNLSILYFFKKNKPA